MINSSESKGRVVIAFPGQEKRVDPTQGSTERTLLDMILSPYNNLIHRLQEIKDSIFYGNSFGIYAALIASQAITPEDGFNLVDTRGQIVRRTEDKAALEELEAQNRGENTIFMGRTGMLRLIGIDPNTKNIKAKYHLNTSNDYGLIKVETGYQNAINQAVNDLGNPRGATVLDVDGAYHDPKRKADSQEFSKVVESTTIEKPKYGLIVSSTNARVLTHPDDIREELVGMMIRPVIFADVLRVLRENGASIALDLDKIASFKKITSRIDDAKEWLRAFSQQEQDSFFNALPNLLTARQESDLASS